MKRRDAIVTGAGLGAAAMVGRPGISYAKAPDDIVKVVAVVAMKDDVVYAVCEDGRMFRYDRQHDEWTPGAHIVQVKP